MFDFIFKYLALLKTDQESVVLAKYLIGFNTIRMRKNEKLSD